MIHMHPSGLLLLLLLLLLLPSLLLLQVLTFPPLLPLLLPPPIQNIIHMHASGRYIAFACDEDVKEYALSNGELTLLQV